MRRLLIAVAMQCGSAALLSAQSRPPVRGGLTGSIGFAVKQSAYRCPECGDSGRRGGGGGRFSLGLTVRRDLIVALESEGGGSGSGQGDWRGLGWTSVVALWYPQVDRRWFVKAGVGNAAARVSGVGADTSAYLDAEGRGVVGGVGYDLRVGRVVSITPYATWAYARSAALRTRTGQSLGTFGGHSMFAGVALTVH